MSDHARLGPSNHRWPHCPGSVREEAKYPDVAGAAAIDGTGSHLLLELCFDNNVRAESYVGEIIGVNHDEHPSGWLVDVERAKRVQMCLDYVAKRVEHLRVMYDSHGPKIVVEAESKANPGAVFISGTTDDESDWWGTCDITITVIAENGKCLFIEVVDYKDGRGWVDANHNSQLISYAGGKAEPYIGLQHNFCINPNAITHGFTCTIVQPKTNPVVRSCDYSSRDLIDRLIELNDAAKLTREDDAPLVPDDKQGKGHCKWCKHKSNCAALNNKGFEVVNTMATDLQVDTGSGLLQQIGSGEIDVTTMESDKLSELLDAEPALLAVFDKIRTEIQSRITNGDTVDGYEMLPGRATRVWSEDEDVIAKALRGRKLTKDDIYPPKLISVAQALKHPKLNDQQKARLEKDYVSTVAGKMRLTQVARKSNDNAALMFADVATESPQSFL